MMVRLDGGDIKQTCKSSYRNMHHVHKENFLSHDAQIIYYLSEFHLKHVSLHRSLSPHRGGQTYKASDLN